MSEFVTGQYECYDVTRNIYGGLTSHVAVYFDTYGVIRTKRRGIAGYGGGSDSADSMIIRRLRTTAFRSLSGSIEVVADPLYHTRGLLPSVSPFDRITAHFVAYHSTTPKAEVLDYLDKRKRLGRVRDMAARLVEMVPRSGLTDIERFPFKSNFEILLRIADRHETDL